MAEEDPRVRGASMIRWVYRSDEDWASLAGYDIELDGSPLNGMLLAWARATLPLPLPRTPENDADIQSIVEALARIDARLQAQET